RVGALHGFAGSDPTDERIKEQLETKGRGPLFTAYQTFRAQEASARDAGDAANVAVWGQAAQVMLQGWYDAGLIFREVSASPALQAGVRERGNYARRYDPIRSTVEHDALRRRKVNLAGETANLKVAVADLCPEYENADLRLVYERRVAADLG